MKYEFWLGVVLLLLACAGCSRNPDAGGAPATPPDVAAPPPDAHGTPEGVFSRVLRKGTGTRRPTPNDTVTVHYSGWTTDGKMFDSSVIRAQPATFKLSEVIPGWTIGVGQMVEGERRRLWIPEKLAYQGRPGA